MSTQYVLLQRSLLFVFLAVACGCTVEARPLTLTDAAVSDAAVDASPDAFAPDAAPACSTEGSTLGEACVAHAECDDFCFCDGVERCESGVCVVGVPACVGPVGEDEPACVVPVCFEAARVCGTAPDDALCDDDEPCNGAEVCSRTRGCVGGSAPSCDDADVCTIDSCELGEGCVHAPRDLDRDGHPDVRCGGDDCDDDPRSGGETFPGGGEDCANLHDDDCDGAVDFEDTDCTPTNDDCASATPLLSEGRRFGTTRGLDADVTLSCAPAGPDALYLLHLDGPTDVTVSAHAGSTTVSLALRTLASCAAGPDLRCASRSGPSFLARSLPEGDYVIVVRTPIPGPFTLDLALDVGTTPPVHDACAATTELLTPGVTVSARLDEVGDDVRVACRDDNGAVQDAVHRLVIDVPSDVVITGAATGGVSSEAAYVALVTSCDGPRDSLACVVDRAPVLRRRALAPGTYFVVLEPEDGTALGYTLRADVTPAADPSPGDACASALEIPASGHVSIPVASLLGDGGTSCGGSTQRDATLRLTLDAPADVMITAHASGGSGETIAIRTDCDVVGSDLACRAGALSVRALAAGTYTLVVTTGASTGDLVVDVATQPSSPAVPADHCERAIDASLGVRATGTFAGATDDLRGGTCSSGGRPDVFYVLSLPTETRVLALAESLVPGIVSITLREGACAGSEVACQSGTTAAFERVLPPGGYVLVVEGDQPVLGGYRLRVDVEPP